MTNWVLVIMLFGGGMPADSTPAVSMQNGFTQLGCQSAAELLNSELSKSTNRNSGNYRIRALCVSQSKN